VSQFVAERKWEPFHDPKNLAMAITIEAAELMEHFQWARSEDLAQVTGDEKIAGDIRDEMADVFCYLLALSNCLGIDLAHALEQKMVKNRRKYPADEFRGKYYKPE
jgi:NTP pyrophosphatase (non-canonical NTP hydrolase)